MIKPPPINADYLLDVLLALIKTPSPTGFTERAVELVQTHLNVFEDLAIGINNKGALVARWPGASANAPRAVTAHVDTLGAMVKEIKSNGRLRLTPIGGFAWNTVEGEGCTVFTQEQGELRGSFLLNHASSHVHGSKVNETKREADVMELRLDARTTAAEETLALGVDIGDFVAFDPRIEVNRGFIRSRFLDDKAGVASLLAAVAAVHEAGLTPSRDVVLHISNYEGVGHGASAGLPPEISELLAVDMAAIGEGQASDEFHATLCVKDSGGPYHHEFCQRLRDLAKEQGIPHRVDIYPYYGSDGEAYWRAGGDVAVALIGPGVDASHNYERTHIDSLVATADWISAYLLS